MRKTLVLGLGLVASVMLVGCDSIEPEPVPDIFKPGYFKFAEEISCTGEMYECEHGGGEVTLNLYGTVNEDYIAITKMADDEEHLRRGGLYCFCESCRQTPHFRAPFLELKEQGITVYPDNYIVDFQWIHVSTEKHAGEANGTVTIQYDANDTGSPRTIYILFENELTGTLKLTQE